MGVTYSPALADRAQAYQDRPLVDKRSPEGLQKLAAIWSAIQGQPAGRCYQCQYADFNATVAAYLRDFSRLQTPELMSDSSYQLAPQFVNETLVHEDYGRVVTADNLTDADVEFFTKKGRGDLFVKKNNTVSDTVDPTSPPEDDPNKGATQVTSDKPLVPQADLEAEQAAHQVTKQALADEKQHGKDALKAEKEAHKATKKELSEVQKQLAEAQKQLAAIAAKAADAAPVSAAPAGDATATPAS